AWPLLHHVPTVGRRLRSRLMGLGTSRGSVGGKSSTDGDRSTTMSTLMGCSPRLQHHWRLSTQTHESLTLIRLARTSEIRGACLHGILTRFVDSKLLAR